MMFVFHENKDLHQPSSTLFIDCGLFSVGVVLHLVANLEVESNTFNQAKPLKTWLDKKINSAPPSAVAQVPHKGPKINKLANRRNEGK